MSLAVRIFRKMPWRMPPWSQDKTETRPWPARGRERYRRALLMSIASLGARGIGVLTLAVSIPLTVRYLGTERYGLWMTIASLIGFLNFANLGLDHGLLNAIAGAHGRDDREAAAKYVSSAFFMILAAAALFGGTLVAVGWWIPWAQVFNISSPEAVAEAGPAVVAFVLCFVVGMPLGVVNQVQLGYQEGFINSLWDGGGKLLGLLALVVAIRLEAGLPWLVLAASGAPVLATLLNGAVLFAVRRPWLMPSLRRADRQAAVWLFKRGIWFFAALLGGGLLYWSDNLIVARMLGASAVAAYAVAFQLFGFVAQFVALFLGPLWPAYGEALARGDSGWIVQAFRRSLAATTAMTGVMALALIFFGRSIIELWVGVSVSPPESLLVGLALWMVLNAGWSVSAMLLNGLNRLRLQAAIVAATGIGAIGAKILLAREFGLPGIAWGNAIAYGLLAGVPLAFFIPRVLAELRPPPPAAEGRP